MPSEFHIKLRYLYLFVISLWLMLASWFGYQFQQHLFSSQSPKVVNELCRSILDNMFLTDGIFAFVTFIISGIIFWRRRTAIYFLFSYIIYTTSTTVSMFTLNDELINYQKNHGIWQGGVPMGQFIYVFLLMGVGVITISSYILVKLVGWMRNQIRNRNQ